MKSNIETSEYSEWPMVSMDKCIDQAEMQSNIKTPE
jgi:hypothetical protein